MKKEKKLYKGTLVAVVCWATVAQVHASAVPLVNPGFEANWTGTADPGYPLYESGYVASPTGPDVGWTFHTGTADAAGVTNANTLWGGTAFEGVRFAWLQDSDPTNPFGAQATYIEQSFSLSTASSMMLNFEQANRAAYSSGQPSTLDVAIDGSVVGSFTVGTSSWVAQSLALPTLAAGTHELAFSNATPARNGEESVYLDAVSLGAVATSVPESAPWALMLAGIGAIGFAGRRLENRSRVRQDGRRSSANSPEIPV